MKTEVHREMSAENEARAAQAVHEAVARRRTDYLRSIERRARGAVDAEDVLQRALVRALEKSEQLHDPARAEAWVGRIVRSMLMNQLRVRPRRESLDEETLAALEEEERSPCRCVTTEARALSPTYAEILQRVIIEGASITEAAQALEIAPNAASVRLFRARAALKKRVDRCCGARGCSGCGDCDCG